MGPRRIRGHGGRAGTDERTIDGGPEVPPPGTSTGRARRISSRTFPRGPINNWTEAASTGAVLALDVATGEQRWKFPMTDVTDSGILTTASDVLFTGGREGYFQALDARSGALLWKASLGAQIVSGRSPTKPMGNSTLRPFLACPCASSACENEPL